MQRFHSNSMVTGKSVRSYVLWMPSLHSLPVWKQLALNVHAFSWAARGTLQSRFTCLCGVAAGSPAAAICQWNKSFVCMSVFCARKMGILFNHSLLPFKYLSLILLWLIRGNPQGYPGEPEIRALRDPIRNTAGYRLTLSCFSLFTPTSIFPFVPLLEWKKRPIEMAELSRIIHFSAQNLKHDTIWGYEAPVNSELLQPSRTTDRSISFDYNLKRRLV